MQSLRAQTFDLNDFQNWKAHLDQEGYAVIHEVLAEENIQEAFNLFQQDIGFVSPRFDLTNPDTFNTSYLPAMFAKGMAVFSGFGNSDFMWYLRTQPRILAIYEQLYQTPAAQLCVSMDGFSLFVSSEQKPGQWLHIDQNPANPIYSIQGAYNFLPVNETSAGFVVVPRSHLIYKPKVDRNQDWVLFDKYNEGFNGLDELAVKLLIPANCFVIWNSRTLHANTGIANPRGKRVKALDRLTCYISYLPRNYQQSGIREQKIQAYLDGETTSHWSNKCDIKRYPRGFGSLYESRGYRKIKPRLDGQNRIPTDRLNLL